MKAIHFVMLLVLVAVAGVAFGILQNSEYSTVLLRFLKGGRIGSIIADSQLTEIIQREVAMPAPLRRQTSDVSGNLTAAGVLAETNRYRLENNLKVFSSNPKLDLAAKAKLDDMFARQYFDHIAPDGTGPADVIKKAGYAYIRVGENLALGNFASDADLVKAWMDSPGHRANILSAGFSELGVAVGKGIYEGRETWLAVQSFGLPASLCPAPEEAVIKSFEQQKADIEKTANDLAAQRSALEKQTQALNVLIEEVNNIIRQGDNTEEAKARQASVTQQRNELVAKQQQYNEAVKQFNASQKQVQQSAAALNKKINAFNNCIKEYTETGQAADE